MMTSAFEQALFEEIATDVRQLRVGAAMAKLARWADRLAQEAHDGTTQQHLAACGQAATRFAEEWGTLIEVVAARMRVATESQAAWIPCPAGCGVAFCALHGEHVATCACPPLDQWEVDPFEWGGPGGCPGGMN